MIKYVIALVVGAIGGGFAGNFITHRIEEPHHHPRAVMHLLGFHRERLDAASQAGQCATVDIERGRLTSLQQEISLAFPKAYGQDADFRKDADALGTVLQAINAVDMPVAVSGPGVAAAAAPAAAAPAASSCPDAVAQFNKINDTCDNCHKVYDPE
jgi:hypothetical protein